VRICVINHPDTTNLTPLNNLIKILTTTTPPIYLIIGDYEFHYFKTENNINTLCISNKKIYNPFLRIFNYLFLQINIIKKIVILKNKVDSFIFFIGGDTLLFPIIFSRLLNKKVILLLAGSSIKTHESNYDSLVSGLKFLRFFSLHFANEIIVYSKLLIQDYHITSYRHKILIAHEHFLDFTKFTIITPYSDRPPLIGYIGRLSAEKGVQNFTEALSAIISNQQDLHVIIGGDGPLRDAIETALQEAGIADHVDFPGWISHDDLPKYLNQLRLLVLPSYTEGLPNIMLEAMACGTPVLATSVGAIPDVIQDEVTGFIMENNTPECIAQNVMRALNHPDLEGIAERGRQYVEKEFTFEKAVERWREILNDI